ncbi:hypothetical protein [Anaerobaca lacustris]|uniref:Uncharacterized protein n=1 Tax=Anaerobaca lacustris TaxID=3044600 RepID=A0AAW6U0E1_9BACT|nr:hypothetical protein [Sedimentisphaerales bacterium M17dextr]
MDNEDGGARGPERSPEFVAVPGGLQCPQCGSTRVRSRNRALSRNVVALLAVGPLLVLAFAFESCIFGLLWFVAVVLPAFTLPVSVCVAAVGRHRCRDCGCRFLPGREAERVPFPWCSCGLNIALLVVLCAIGPIVMRWWDNWGRASHTMADTNGIFTAGFLVWASLVYQIAIYKGLGRRLRSRFVWLVLFIWPGIVLGSSVFSISTPSARAEALLSRARLAPLPASATGIRVYEWSSPFSGEEFLRFAAEPNDVEKFLRESPALQGQEPEHFSAERMRLPTSGNPEKDWESQVAGHETYVPRPTIPDWYKQKITGPARRYIVQPERYQYPGHVLVDDEEHVVYIYLIFS